MANQSRKIGIGCVYSLSYHLVWCPKRRSPVLVGGIADDLKTLIVENCKNLGMQVESLEVMSDHVHLFVSAPPKFSPYQIVKKLKGSSSNLLRKKYPQLLKLPALWSSSYYVGSVGHVSDSVVRHYIENQRGK